MYIHVYIYVYTCIYCIYIYVSTYIYTLDLQAWLGLHGLIIILGSFWDHFDMILGSFWGSELPWTPSDAGGRVVGSHQISQQKQAN